jgi:hypothetical protein
MSCSVKLLSILLDNFRWISQLVRNLHIGITKMKQLKTFALPLNFLLHVVDVPLERFAFQILSQLFLLRNVTKVVSVAHFAMIKSFVIV